MTHLLSLEILNVTTVTGFRFSFAIYRIMDKYINNEISS